jgi:hypothetical protein
VVFFRKVKSWGRVTWGRMTYTCLSYFLLEKKRAMVLLFGLGTAWKVLLAGLEYVMDGH